MAGNELFIQGKKFISLKRASELSGYAKDYVGQLCRCGKIKSERVGRDWFVDLENLLCYKKNKIESTKKILQQKEIVGKIDSQNKDISSRRAIELGAIFENFKNKVNDFFSTKDSWDKELFEGSAERKSAKPFVLLRSSATAKDMVYGFAVILLIFGFVRYSSQVGEIYTQWVQPTGKKIASELYNIGSSLKMPEIHPVRNFYGALDSIKTNIVLTKNFASEKISDISNGVEIPDISFPEIKFPQIALPKINFSRFAEISLPEINFAKKARKIFDVYLATIYSTGDAFASFSVGASNKTVALLNQAKAFELPEIKMPGIALPKIHKPNFSKIVLALANVKHSMFDTASNMAFVGNVFSDTAKNILVETKNSFALFPQNVKEVVRGFLGVKDFFAPRSELAINQNYNESVYQEEINALKLELSQIKNKGLAVQSPIVQKTIVEKSVEKIIYGLTSEEIDARLNETNEKLMAQILDVKNKLVYRTDSIANATVASTYQAVALTNKIDNLSGVTINNATITGTLGGLTDAMIPDSITASNYLLLSGGTITGELTVTATTTFNGVAYGWPSVDGSANYVLSTNGAGALSWVAQTGGGGTINQLGQIGDVSTSTLAYGHLLMWNGVDTWQDTATSSLGITSGITSLNGQTGATQTFATSSDTNIGLTITSSGDIHTFTSNWIGSLAVSRGGTGLTSYTSGDILYANTTSTLAGTSTANLKTTLGLNLVENTALSTWAGSSALTTLGTIGTGVWNAGAVTSSGAITGTYFVATGAAATSTFAGGLAIETSGFVYDYSTNNVGIGKSNPSSKLDVAGSINISAGSYYKYNGANFAMADTNLNNYFSGGAGNLTMTGTQNTAMGMSALGVNTTGNYNTAMGLAALNSNTTGESNTAYGRAALNNNISGSYNIAVGMLALYSNTASNNTAVGYGSGTVLTSGANNILLGYQSGDNLTTGANNIILGYDIDAPLASSANTLNIGNLIFGTGINGTGTTLSSGNIGIGTTSPYAKLSVVGEVVASYFTATSTATSTAANGWNITAGCFAINGVCVGTGAGTVTSVAMSVPTGLTISGSPITTSGTLALTYTAGYEGLLTTDKNNWNTAYGWGDHSIVGYLLGSNYYSTTTHPLISSLPSLSITESQISDLQSYLTGNQTITLSGAVTGSGATSILTQLATTTFDYWFNNSAGITGNSNIATLGTIGTGVWQGTAVGAQYGGTGLTSYTSGDVLYANTTTSLTGTSTANLKTTLGLNLVENTALSTWAGTSNITTVGTLTSGAIGAGFTVIDDAYISSATTWNAKQTGDADLTAIAALTNTKGNLIVGGPSSAWVALGIGADGKVLTASSTATNGVSWETVAGGGGSGTVTSVDVSGGTTGFTFSGGPITTAGTITMAGTLGVGYGGTGATTLTGLLQGNGAGAITGITGTAGQFPYYNGTNTLLATSSVFLASSGNVGIGTTTPNWKLQVAGASPYFALSDTSAGLNAKHWLMSSSAGVFSLASTTDVFGSPLTFLSIDTSGTLSLGSGGTNLLSADSTNTITLGSGSEAMRIIDNGNVGIGTTSPWRTLSVNGTAVFTGLTNDGTGYYLCLNTTSGEMSTSTTACTASSLQFKENISELTYGLKEVMELKPVFFSWKKDFISDDRRQLGLVAEEVEPIIPEIIGYNNEGKVMNLDYPKLTAVLVKATQELAVRLDGVKDEILTWLEDKVLTVRKLFVKDEICIGNTCVNEEQLKQLLANVGQPTSDVGLDTEPPVVSDVEPPTLTLQGNNPAKILVGSTYADMGVAVTDNVDKNLGYEVWRNGIFVGRNLSGVSVDTGKPAEWTISYVATDNAGNTATTTRNVLVEAPNSNTQILNNNQILNPNDQNTATTTATTTTAQ